jgi:hypothetical protein
MQFGGSGATSGRDSGFCITITCQDTQLVALQFLTNKKILLSSPNNSTLQISLRLTSGYFLL